MKKLYLFVLILFFSCFAKSFALKGYVVQSNNASTGFYQNSTVKKDNSPVEKEQSMEESESTDVEESSDNDDHVEDNILALHFYFPYTVNRSILSSEKLVNHFIEYHFPPPLK